MTRRKRQAPIHQEVKERLGYDPIQTDEEVYDDWIERTRRVCKPCWELKYCPFGPLVEQSPLLPVLRQDAINHHEYIVECLASGKIGNLVELSPELRSSYKSMVEDDQALLHYVLSERESRLQVDSALEIEDEEERLDHFLSMVRGGPLPPIHIYRVPFSQSFKAIVEEDFSAEVWEELALAAQVLRESLQHALVTGLVDNRKDIDPVRRKHFQREASSFNPEDYPDVIPEVFSDASCNVFGHICPVFFTAEDLTETDEQRRIGRRHLKFETMMRIVRRDDYRCQHCMKKLQDNEVEFDHIIPVSKGGASTEHNIRLTCFDCNRDKSDDFDP